MMTPCVLIDRDGNRTGGYFHVSEVILMSANICATGSEAVRGSTEIIRYEVTKERDEVNRPVYREAGRRMMPPLATLLVNIDATPEDGEIA